jgi:hypothetical protein
MGHRGTRIVVGAAPLIAPTGGGLVVGGVARPTATGAAALTGDPAAAHGHLAAWTHGAGISFARVADDRYHTAGFAVALSALETGDLVSWGTSQTDWTTVYHTALYVGGNRIVEATGDQVQLNVLGQWGSGDLMPNGRRP